MAADDKDHQPGEDGDPGRAARARRKKTPVILDLTASQASSAAVGAPTGERERPAADATSERPEGRLPGAGEPKGPARGAEAAPTPGLVDKATAYWRAFAAPPWGIGHLAAAAVAGAILAVVVIEILSAAGFLFEPSGRAAREAAAQADQAAAAGQRAIATLRTDLDGLRRAPAAAPAAGLQALADRVGKIEAEAARIAAIDDRLRALAAAPSPDAATSGLVARLASEVSAVRQQVETLTRGAAAAPTSTPGDRLVLDALGGRVDGLVARLDALAAIGERERTFEQAARVMATTSLTAAAARGDAFGAEVDVLRSLGVAETQLGALRAMAGGVPSLASLQARFAKTGDAIVEAANRPPADAGFAEWMLYQARSLVSVRPTGPVAGDSAEAIVSRMQARVAAGDLGAALSERGALSPVAKDASAGWAKDAAARIALNDAVAGLSQTVGTGGPEKAR